MSNIVVPELGESVVEATVAKWLKKEGDPVAVGEPVVELETEKIDLEVGANQDGVLAKIARQAGADVKIGEVLGVIEETQAKSDSSPPPTAQQPTKESATAAASGAPVTTPGGEATPSGEPAALADKTRATPSARRLAAEKEVDLTAVRGSGDRGRVTRRDVESHAPVDATETEAVSEARSTPSALQPVPASRPVPEAKAARQQGDSDRPEERVRMSRRRLTIARRLVEAQHTAAMLTTFNEADMSAVQGLRQRHKDAFKQRNGVNLGLTSFFVKAAIAALRQQPLLNAEVQGEEMVVKHYYDIGVAVGASGGLVVPVLRDADRMSISDIEKAVKEFARKAEDGSLSLDDLRGGTFTITNGGVFGSLMSTPILNPPQVGILGLHKIEDRPVALQGQVVIRPMMYLALSYDHRIVDGSEAVQFLVKVKQIIEDPMALLLD